jgi:hypothetical protein
MVTLSTSRPGALRGVAWREMARRAHRQFEPDVW